MIYVLTLLMNKKRWKLAGNGKSQNQGKYFEI